jgi:hypothetical protein
VMVKDVKKTDGSPVILSTVDKECD